MSVVAPMNEPGAERWKELLQGRRQWAAINTTQEILIRFAIEVVDPLRAMEDARMVRLEFEGAMYGGIRLEHEVRVIEVAEWVHDLGRRAPRPQPLA
jgi:hypothetical protein